MEYTTIHREIGCCKRLRNGNMLAFILADDIHRVQIWVKCLKSKRGTYETDTRHTKLHGIVVQVCQINSGTWILAVNGFRGKFAFTVFRVDFEGKITSTNKSRFVYLCITSILTIGVADSTIISSSSPSTTLRQTSHIVRWVISHSDFTIVDFKLTITNRLFSLRRCVVVIPI